MTTYASIKGQPTRTAPQASTTASAAPAEDLPSDEMERIADNRAFVIEHMPELVDLIKELHAAGLIVGWRSVQNCKSLSRKVSP